MLQEHERDYLVINAATCRSHFAADFNETSNHSEQPAALAEPQTFEDVARLQRHIEEQSRLSHARVFERVYASLGVAPGAALAPNDEVLLALERRAKAKQVEEEATRIRLLEAEEARVLRMDRERLRGRFDEGSPDAEGVDPLADAYMAPTTAAAEG